MRCPSCSNEVSPEWKRCPYCEYKPKLCSKEGCESGWLPAEAHFCPTCGSPVKGEENLRLKEIIARAIVGVAPLTSSDCTNNSSASSKWYFNVDGVKFKMIRVKGGTFTMGATSEQENYAYDLEKPAHKVTLSTYYMGETEVTQALWQAVMGSNPSKFKGENLPVEKVSWDDCKTFISKLNSLTGKNFRLPTEAEWEYAARGGNKSQGYKYSGSNTLVNVAWYKDNSGNETHPVKTKSPNELGLYDMSGNVWEWCQDWYETKYYSSSSQTNPTGPSSGSGRVIRGGCWSNYANNCRSSHRYGYSPDNANYYLGFRLVLSELRTSE